ncbi:unnamed protein product [Amoebophrya sp. A120]|nr:unnamed protein product [Amoebophrya sp. A120]|eukprot:GSA120T00013148001.1
MDIIIIFISFDRQYLYFWKSHQNQTAVRGRTKHARTFCENYANITAVRFEFSFFLALSKIGDSRGILNSIFFWHYF